MERRGRGKRTVLIIKTFALASHCTSVCGIHNVQNILLRIPRRIHRAARREVRALRDIVHAVLTKVWIRSHYVPDGRNGRLAAVAHVESVIECLGGASVEARADGCVGDTGVVVE